MQLSILIPTYNRANYLNYLLPAVAGCMKAFGEIDWELVVSDNCSQDETAQLCQRLHSSISQLRRIAPPQHLYTAEENLFFALNQVGGTYTWVLGDDDVPQAETIGELIRQIQQEKYDLMIFNSGSIDYHGHRLRMIRTPCHTPILEISFQDFIRRTGCWFVIAGFSTILLRTDCVKGKDVQQLLRAGKIYSHVTFLVEHFSDKKFAFINKPLVWYRQNLIDIRPASHWDNVARRENTFPRALWTLSFIRQLKYLQDKKIIDEQFFPSILDQTLTHRFRLFYELITHLIIQIKLNMRLNAHLKMNRGDFNEILDFLKSCSPAEWDLWKHLEELFALQEKAAGRFYYGRAAREYRAKFSFFWNYMNKIKKHFIHPFFDRFQYGYHIFKTPFGWCACQPRSIALLYEELQFIDPKSRGHEIIFSDTEDELTSAMQNGTQAIHRENSNKLLYYVPRKRKKESKLNRIKGLFLKARFRLLEMIKGALRRLRLR